MVDIPFEQILLLMMSIKIVITLHVYLVLRQLIKDGSIVLTASVKKAKKLQKKSCLLQRV